MHKDTSAIFVAAREFRPRFVAKMGWVQWCPVQPFTGLEAYSPVARWAVTLAAQHQLHRDVVRWSVIKSVRYFRRSFANGCSVGLSRVQWDLWAKTR